MMNSEPTKEERRPRRREAQHTTDKLASNVERTRQTAKHQDSQGRADSKNVPKTPKGSHAILSWKITDRWKKITWILEFLLKVTKLVCSFINYTSPSKNCGGCWSNYKVFA